MFRSLLLVAAFALVLGCSKNEPEKPASNPAPNPAPSTEPSDTAKKGPDFSASLPKLQAKAKFKFSGKRLNDNAVQLSADGKTLAVAYSNANFKSFVQVWDISGEPKAVAEFDGGTFALSPSGKYLATTGNLSPAVYEIATKKPVAKLNNLFSHVFFRDDNTLVFTMRSYNFPQATKGKIMVWDVAKNADAGSFDIPDNRFNNVLPANGGKEIWLFMANQKFEVECYDIAAKKLLRTVKPVDEKGKPYTTSGIWESVAPDASVFAADVSKLTIYDATTGKIVGTLPDGIWGTPTGFIPGGNRYLARASAKIPGLTENDYVIYDWKARKPLATVVGHAATDKDPLAAASADGKTLVSVTKAGEGLIFDISSAK